MSAWSSTVDRDRAGCAEEDAAVARTGGGTLNVPLHFGQRADCPRTVSGNCNVTLQCGQVAFVGMQSLPAEQVTLCEIDCIRERVSREIAGLIPYTSAQAPHLIAIAQKGERSMPVTELHVNGARQRLDTDPERSLLSVLRDDLD